jgi:peptidoglycan hydrolase FlgJ
VAINPPSDLVLDVAEAAQAGKLREATARLESKHAENAGEAFQAALATAAANGQANAAATADPGASARPAGRNAPMIRKENSEAKALQKLEAYFLQTAVQDMLPKNAEHVFGAGLAGDIWKSMLAEQIAAEMAKSAKFGIAERLAGKHFALASAHGEATGGASSIARPDAINHTGSKNLPFLRDHRAPDLPASGVVPATATKRS